MSTDGRQLFTAEVWLRYL